MKNIKKLILILPIFLVFGLTLPVFAVNNSGVGAQNTGTAQQTQVKTTPTISPVKNQNQVKTQNQGEDSQLQVTTQEQENLGTGQGDSSQNRSQTAVQHMSIVAQKVQELFQLKTTGGIGDQVRQVARDQNQAQTQIQTQLNKIDSKGQLAKFLTGTDYEAVKNLRNQLAQNQLRIRLLEQLKNQLTNVGDQTMIQETIQALIQENTSLQDKIVSEEEMKSLFGWLFKLFAD